MAYLRKKEHLVDIDYSIIKVWNGILEIIPKLEWTLTKKDKATHEIEVVTNKGLLSYASKLFIKIWSVDKKTTRIRLHSETPVTTITSVVDFGRIEDRNEAFFEALGLYLTAKKESKTKTSKT